MSPLSILKTPRDVPTTGDDSAASGVLTYVWRMSGYHQIAVCALAVIGAGLNLVPIELQRRIVNEVVETQQVPVLVRFGIIYIAVLLLHQFLKYVLRMYQSWLSESAVLYTRSHLLTLYADGVREDAEDSGKAVSIVGAEVEKLGGFVGAALSGAFANAAMLLGVCVYMLVVQPQIALFALAFLVPQVVLTPMLQRRLNDLVEKRVGYMRSLGDDITRITPETADQKFDVLAKVYRNHMRFFALKFALKAMLNLLSALGPATVLIFGGYLVMQGEAQVGVIVAFVSGFDRLAGPLRELIAFYRVAAQAGVQHRLIAKWMAKM